jgi:ParB-like chromosome segregation protein Spo0J
MEASRIAVDSIEIGERHRALSEDAVQRLAKSMADIGLRSPITVRVVDDYVLPDGEVCDGVPVLVAGAHRLAAAKVLGWTHIDCIDADDDAITAELWELAENLHRLDLTKEQRDEHIRRYAELIEARQLISTQTAAKLKSESNPKGAGRPVSTARKVAEETGLSVDTVRRALAPKPPEPKAPLADYDVVTVQYNALMAAWNRAGSEARTRFIDSIDGAL